MGVKSKQRLSEIIENEISEQILLADFKPSELYEPIKYVLKIGGKRIRPLMTLMACNLFTSDFKHAIKPALALEIFHNFTLLHDDIMDNAELRRNMPTVHKKWNANTAILSGDAMSIMAYQFLEGLDAEELKQVLPVFSSTAMQVCEGQQFDMNFETDSKISVEEYLKMIELKTSVLIAASVKIGAIIGGAHQQDAEYIYEFGKNIGLAFQLQDDYLDVYGDAKVFGKNIGGDIVANKKTYLLIKALEIAEGEVLSKLNLLLSEKSFIREEKVNAVTDIYNQLNVKELSKAKMNEYFETGMNFLSKINVPDENKEELKDLVISLMSREN